MLENIILQKLDEHLPQKKFSSKDKKLMIAELKKIYRCKKREWAKRGKSANYLELKNKFDTKYKEALEKYLEKHVSDLKVYDPGKAFDTLKRLGAKD